MNKYKQLKHQIHNFVEKLYTKGYMKGSFNNKAYKQGVNDAWECVKKIHSFDLFTYDKIFKEYAKYKYIFEKLSSFEAMQKIKEYEEKQIKKSCEA